MVLGTIVQSWNFPGRDQRGIETDGRNLFIIDWAGVDRIHVHKKTAGLELLEDWVSPFANPRGLAFDGKHLWTINAAAPNTIVCLNCPPRQGAAPQVIKAIPRMQAWGIFGLTFDGKYLIVDQAGWIEWLNPLTDIYIDRWVPGFGTATLCWDGKYLWDADSTGNLIRCLDLTSRVEVTNFAFAAPTGIAFDGKYLWIVDATNVYCVEKS